MTVASPGPTLALVSVPPNGKDVLIRALEAGFAQLVFDSPPGPGFLRLGKFDAFVLEGEVLSREGKAAGARVVIRNKADEDRARKLADADGIVIVSATDWKVIPLENLIAAFQGRRARLVAEVSSAEEARLFLDTLEVGVHGVLLRPAAPREIARLREILDRRRVPPVALEEAVVESVKPAGVGDRVCIDSCSLLSPGEGMLVGSAAGALFLVASEAEQSEYVASRPFRVNAGPVHAYVLCPEGKTKYLSELEAGDEVLAVNAKGEARVVVVGRCKMERRPLLLVTVESRGKSASTILQNAETIRLVTPEGTKSVSELKRGDKVLLRADDVGRHFGMAVKETLVER